MIVSHRYKFIFLKTSKTAGTSIEIALSQYCGETDIITPITPKDEEVRQELGYRGPQNYTIPLTRYRLRHWKHLLTRGTRARYYNHMPAAELRRLVGPKVWTEYFKFSFERNPWDKAISSYFWKTRGLEPRPSLLDFLRSVTPDSLSSFRIYSIDGEVAVDLVGRYEQLDAELQHIATRLGLPGAIALPRAKGSFRQDRRHYRDIIGEEERSIIERICGREIKHFGYSF
jgi:hypothetical protein